MADMDKPTRSTVAGRRSKRLACKLPMESSEPPVEATEALSTLEPRRNPKRKSSQVNGPALDLPEDLLTAAYEPLTDREREEWEGWVELESDPVRSRHRYTDAADTDVCRRLSTTS